METAAEQRAEEIACEDLAVEEAAANEEHADEFEERRAMAAWTALARKYANR